MAEILFSRENKLRPSMAVAGKSHIFPGLDYNYNKKKYIFFIVLERTKFKPKSWVPL